MDARVLTPGVQTRRCSAYDTTCLVLDVVPTLCGAGIVIYSSCHRERHCEIGRIMADEVTGRGNGDVVTRH
jgi:hypothetical protein